MLAHRSGMLGRSRAKAATSAMARAQDKDRYMPATRHQFECRHPLPHMPQSFPRRYVQPSPPLVDDMYADLVPQIVQHVYDIYIYIYIYICICISSIYLPTYTNITPGARDEFAEHGVF